MDEQNRTTGLEARIFPVIEYKKFVSSRRRIGEPALFAAFLSAIGHRELVPFDKETCAAEVIAFWHKAGARLLHPDKSQAHAVNLPINIKRIPQCCNIDGSPRASQPLLEIGKFQHYTFAVSNYSKAAK